MTALPYSHTRSDRRDTVYSPVRVPSSPSCVFQVGPEDAGIFRVLVSKYQVVSHPTCILCCYQMAFGAGVLD